MTLELKIAREALERLAKYPSTRADEMSAAGMRQYAREVLAALTERLSEAEQDRIADQAYWKLVEGKAASYAEAHEREASQPQEQAAPQEMSLDCVEFDPAGKLSSADLIIRGARITLVPALQAAPAVPDEREAFEAWSKREGGLKLKPANGMYCEDFRFPATYYYSNTETAWRAWANKPGAIASASAQPIDIILHCPACGKQHIDAPDDRTPDWKNEPHRSHLCHGCGYIWRPADVPTNGVAAIKTKGKNDSSSAPAQTVPEGACEAKYSQPRKSVTVTFRTAEQAAAFQDSFFKKWKLAAAAAPVAPVAQQPIEIPPVMVPACGDPDCNFCDMVPVAPAQEGGK